MKTTLVKRGGVALAILGASVMLSACGGGGGGGVASSPNSNGTALASSYIQDSVGAFNYFSLGISNITISNGSNTCTLYQSSTPNYINLVSLSGNIAKYMQSQSCPSGTYNQLTLTVSQTVSSIDLNGNSMTLSFPSSTDFNGLSINCQNGLCTINTPTSITISGTASAIDTDINLNSITYNNNGTITFINNPISNSSFSSITPPSINTDIDGYVVNYSNTSTTFQLVDYTNNQVYNVDLSQMLNSSNSSTIYSMGWITDIGINGSLVDPIKLRVVCSSLSKNLCVASSLRVTVSGYLTSTNWYKNPPKVFVNRLNNQGVSMPITSYSIFNSITNALNTSINKSGTAPITVSTICSASGCSSTAYYATVIDGNYTDIGGIPANITKNSFVLEPQDTTAQSISVYYNSFPNMTYNILNQINASSNTSLTTLPTTMINSKVICSSFSSNTCQAYSIVVNINGTFEGYNQNTNTVTLVQSMSNTGSLTYSVPIGSAFFSQPNQSFASMSVGSSIDIVNICNMNSPNCISFID
ncbi:MAG: DUF4382 domain-containing protein [Hydrogenobaculum sp.]